MKNTKKTSLTIAAVTILGLSFISTNADAQGWRNAWGGWGQSSSSCSAERNTLRTDVIKLDRIANQMVSQFSREMHCGCRDNVALLNHLKKNAILTRNLTTALNGSCKCAFKKAACAVNDAMPCLVSQSRKVRNLSCSMKSSISTSAKLAKRVHKNADKFVPRGASYTNHNRPAVPAPVYGRPPVHNHGHDNGSQDDLINVLFSIFNR